jgi:hypothetical protein
MLKEKYPEIFKDLDFIGVGDGWYDILDVLCANIKGHLQWVNANHKEKSEPLEQIRAIQIKEKFGGLRFYINGGDDVIYGMVNMAEAMSYTTCEYCGNKGKPDNSQRWIKTLCPACMQLPKK